MIRKAQKENFSAIGSNNVKAYLEFSKQLPDGAWPKMVENLTNIDQRAASSEFLVYDNGDKIVGSVAYCPAGNGDAAIFDANTASILLLAVDPAHRGQGIANTLTQACVDRAILDGAEKIGLFTSELMVSAQNLYRKLGFKITFELPKRHGISYFLFELGL